MHCAPHCSAMIGPQMPLPELSLDVSADGDCAGCDRAHRCDGISLGHGHEDTLNITGLRVVEHLRINLCKLPQCLLHQICCAIAGRQVRKHIQVDFVMSMLLGVSKITVMRWVSKVDACRNSTLGHKARKSSEMSVPWE